MIDIYGNKTDLNFCKITESGMFRELGYSYREVNWKDMSRSLKNGIKKWLINKKIHIDVLLTWMDTQDSLNLKKTRRKYNFIRLPKKSG